MSSIGGLKVLNVGLNKWQLRFICEVKRLETCRKLEKSDLRPAES